MKGAVETLVADAMQLSHDQRLTLAHRILSSVEPMPSGANNEAWDVEIQGRIARFDAGETRAIPAAEVFADLDRRLRR
ncbi:MAG: addiction module protein [Verrucomicrobiales bacterium]|nr:addiction module protein [Verrucomicrobiales bacterium]